MNYNCKSCNKKHDIKYNNCILDLQINTYKIFNKIDTLNEINKYIQIKQNNKKKYICIKCNYELTSHNNYKYHIQHNVCDKKKLNCDKCMKIFKNNQNLNYHINNNVCKKYTEYTENIDNKNTDNIQNTINNITNNNNIQNTINNITNNNNNIIITVNNIEEFKKIKELIPFQNTKYNSTDNKLFEYLQNPNNAIQKIITDTHFNEEKPENMNILNTNRKDNRLKIYDYDHDNKVKWITKEKDDVCEILYYKCVNELYNLPKNMKKNNMRIDPLKEFAFNSKVMDYNNDRKTIKRYLKLVSDTTYDNHKIALNNTKNNKITNSI